MRLTALALALLFSPLVIGTASSSGSHGSLSSPSNHAYECRNVSVATLVESGLSWPDILHMCNDVCPFPKAKDVKTACDDSHTYHTAISNFRDAQKYHASMQWYAWPSHTGQHSM